MLFDFITTIISVASKTFKTHIFKKCVVVYLMAPRKNNYKLVSKAKIRAAPVPTVVHSPHPSLSQKKGKS
jgi:predicted transcriptional regulator